MKIGLIPIDNRPVCYTLPKLISQIDKSLELILPERDLLGSLQKSANVDAIFEWINSLTSVDAFVISLDTIAYGGLVSSRRCEESFEEIKNRLKKLKPILKGKRVFAFSSIMRISNNNINEEEKLYWDKWGKKIFEYSWNSHKNNTGKVIENDIPFDVLNDYLATRKRNFDINKLYLDWQKEGIFEVLIFSKDDCAEYGFNVQEAQELKACGAMVKTGADEIPLTLLARALGENFSICPIFTEPCYKNLLSNYEDISIEECVKNQIELSGCRVVEDNADVTLLVNNFIERQGEIVMKVPTESFSKKISDFGCFSAVADVRFANGADNFFVKTLLDNQLLKQLIGFSAWNTSANSLGCLMFALKVILSAKKKNMFDDNAFNKFMLTRFLDDWAYQANVRQELNSLDLVELKNKMISYEKILLAEFPINDIISYRFPWDRLFEVEVEFI